MSLCTKTNKWNCFELIVQMTKTSYKNEILLQGLLSHWKGDSGFNLLFSWTCTRHLRTEKSGVARIEQTLVTSLCKKKKKKGDHLHSCLSSGSIGVRSKQQRFTPISTVLSLLFKWNWKLLLLKANKPFLLKKKSSVSGETLMELTQWDSFTSKITMGLSKLKNTTITATV